jgi:N-acetylglutamate synthase-like GNAT family acetyltransferase
MTEARHRANGKNRRSSPAGESSLYPRGPISIFMPMTEPRLVARRATVEDLPQLLDLWRLERLPAEALEKRLTEFQVVADDAGVVYAALGLQLAGAQGWLHSEAIARPEMSDQLRALLWQRLQVIIQNHALERLWTQMPGPFWREQGFVPATDELMKQRPAKFPLDDQPWFVATLRAATAAAALEQEFAELKNLQALEKARTQERVRWMKRLALGVTIGVFLLVVVWAVIMLKLGPRLFQR